MTFDGDPFNKEKLCSHYENCFVKIKEKIYCDYLKENKEGGYSKKTLYSFQGKRKEFVEIEDMNKMIDCLVSEGMVPNHLMPIKKSPQLKKRLKN